MQLDELLVPVSDAPYDLVLFIYNPDLKPWLEKLNFMSIRYKVISNKWYENKDLKSESVVFLKSEMIGNFWKYIYNNFKSFNYGIIGEKDTPENFDIMYLDYLSRGAHIEINNNPKLYDSFNVSFNSVNRYIDVPGTSYMIFKANYLKFCLVNDNGMNMRHRLIYWKNRNENVHSAVVEFSGANTPLNMGALKKVFYLNMSKHKMFIASAVMVAMNVFFIWYNNKELFYQVNKVMFAYFAALSVVNVFTKEVY